VVDEVFDSVRAGEKLISKLRLEKYTHNKVEKKSLLNETNYSYGAYNSNYDFDSYDDYEEYDEIDEMAESITDIVVDLYSNGINEDEIMKEVANYLRGLY